MECALRIGPSSRVIPSYDPVDFPNRRPVADGQLYA
jgi:hypothetical protein